MVARMSTILLAAALCAAALGAESQPSTSPTSSPSPGASTAPAAYVPKVPDVMADAVDPYNPAAERMRFFKAAGVDSELDAKEFEAARGQVDSFIRRFDQWDAMLTFDKDKNKEIDWFEADAYRRDLRERVIRAFDENRDGQLTGPERDRANAALASGRLPNRPGQGAEAARGPRRGPWDRGPLGNWEPDAEELRRFDRDHDGQLSDEERGGMFRGRM